MEIIDKYFVRLPKILCFFIYSYFSSNEHLRISILYNPIDNDIDIKTKKYPNIPSLLIFSPFSRVLRINFDFVTLDI